MEKDLKNIDKHIYTTCDEIVKSYNHITWAFICTALGAVATWLYMSYETIAQDPSWSALALGFIFIGIFSFFATTPLAIAMPLITNLHVNG